MTCSTARSPATKSPTSPRHRPIPNVSLCHGPSANSCNLVRDDRPDQLPEPEPAFVGERGVGPERWIMKDRVPVYQHEAHEDLGDDPSAHPSQPHWYDLRTGDVPVAHSERIGGRLGKNVSPQRCLAG